MKRVLLALIRFYRKYLSRLSGQVPVHPDLLGIWP